EIFTGLEFRRVLFRSLAVHLELPGPLRAQVDRYEASSERSLRLHLLDSDVWVRFGRAERVEDKARVINLLLDQAREQAALQGREIGRASCRERVWLWA